MSHFVEVVFVQLTHEAGKVGMFEVFGKDVLGEAFVLRLSDMSWETSQDAYLKHHKTIAFVAPAHNL